MTEKANQSMRPFFVLWGGQGISLFGSQLVQFALIWWLTAKTGSATVLAMASLVGLLPQVIFGPLIGALVDRWNRKLILFAADAVIALFSLLLAGLFWLEVVEVWHVFLLLFIRALGSAFHEPTMMATTSLMVPEEHFTRVQGLNQSLFAGLSIVSAPLGAVLLEVLSMYGILLIDCGTALFALLPLLVIRIPQPRRATAAPTSVWHDVVAGIRYVRGRTGIVALMLIAAGVNFLLAPTVALMPILASDHFSGGAFQFALMETAISVGILIGGVLLGVWGGFKRRIMTALAGLGGIGLAVVAVGFTPATWLPLALGAIFVEGMMIPLVNGSVHSILQSSVAAEYQGRVFTLVGTLALAMTPIGMIIAGPTADALGVQNWFVMAGAACLLLTGVAVFVPAILSVEQEAAAERAKMQENGEIVGGGKAA